MEIFWIYFFSSFCKIGIWVPFEFYQNSWKKLSNQNWNMEHVVRNVRIMFVLLLFMLCTTTCNLLSLFTLSKLRLPTILVCILPLKFAQINKKLKLKKV
jgi:hypothetical protein